MASSPCSLQYRLRRGPLERQTPLCPAAGAPLKKTGSGVSDSRLGGLWISWQELLEFSLPGQGGPTGGWGIADFPTCPGDSIQVCPAGGCHSQANELTRSTLQALGSLPDWSHPVFRPHKAPGSRPTGLQGTLSPDPHIRTWGSRRHLLTNTRALPSAPGQPLQEADHVVQAPEVAVLAVALGPGQPVAERLLVRQGHRLAEVDHPDLG